MVAFSSAVLAAAAAAGGTLEAALKHAPAALFKFNVGVAVLHDQQNVTLALDCAEQKTAAVHV